MALHAAPRTLQKIVWCVVFSHAPKIIKDFYLHATGVGLICVVKWCVENRNAPYEKLRLLRTLQ
jgi:hypothetical protein